MDYSTTEFKNSTIARQNKSAPAAMIFLTVVVMSAMFVQFANVF